MNNNTEQHWWNDIGNWFIKIFNQSIYFLLAGVYDIIVNISKSQILSGSTVMAFFSRVQLMIGVFMVFRLTITVLQGLIDPEKFMDSKSGFGNIITKMIVSLALLTTLIPINIPNPSNSYEKQLKSNGLLFGILYDFQDRILSQNILAKLVLGTNSTSDSDNQIKDTGDDLSTTLLKNFFTPNLKPEVGNSFKLVKDDDGTLRYNQDDLFCETRNRAEGGDEGNKDPKRTADAYKKYYKSKNPVEILNLINEPCETTTDPSGSKYIKLRGWDAYAFNFNWLIAFICGIIFLFVLVNICIEVAKRAIKLAILRLIAPIPIISYMNPKSSMDNGAFGSWVKTLSTTYIDLFINLLIIYFVLFLMKEIADNNGLVVSDGASGTVVLFSKVFIYIGLLLFAKDAPKFIKQSLGIKDDGGKGWFSGIAAAAGLGAAGIGAIGSARANFQASREENPPGKNLRVRNFGSALVGGMSGMVTGGKAALTAKDHNFKAVTDAMRNRNEQRLSGYTPARNIKTRLAYAVTGNGSSKKYEDIMSDQKAFADYYKHAVGKADVDSTNLSAIGIGGYGNESVKSLKENFERLKIAGADTATLKKAEDRYKNAQAALVGAVIKGRHTSGQASQIKLDYDKAMEISRKYDNTDNKLDMTLNVSGMADGKIAEEWKGAQFTAIDNAYKVEHSDEYAKAKLNDQNSKK